MIFAKTKVMRETNTVGRIVSRLGNPDEKELQRLIDAGILHLSANDIHGKSFLDNDKLGVYDTAHLTSMLMSTFYQTVCERNEVEKEQTVTKAY